MNDAQAVVALLRRTFKGGSMQRLPKRQEDLDIMLALSIVELDDEGIFDESDMNLHLSQWLAEIAAPNGTADYVSLRRALVDHGFLRRATDGMIYRVRAERLDEVLLADARQVDVKQLFHELELARLQRRQSFQR